MSYEAAATGKLSEIPPHVPPGLVIDFNVFSPPGVEDDPHLAFKRLHEGPDIVYTPYNGGHWILTRADDIYAVMHDTDVFSNSEFTIPKRGPDVLKLIPNQLDPPEHEAVKKMVLRPLSPKAIKPVEPMIRALMAARVARIAPKGRCEFVSEFTDVPPELFFEFAGLPKEKLKRAKELVDIIVRTDDTEARRSARLESAQQMSKFLEEWRNKPPADDLFGVIIAQERAGHLTPEESVSLAINVYHGGLETVASALAFIVWFLARNPEHRRQLVNHPELSQAAGEELLRRHGILNLARIAKRRTAIRDVVIEEGEQVMLPLHLASLDERKYENPMEVNFARENTAHMNFGTGVHRCVGSNLARPEIRIFLEEWLKVIPDFSLDPNDRAVGSSGLAMTMARVPLVWPVH